MKTRTIYLALLILVSTTAIYSQGTIPNHDFETWITTTNPKNWQTTTQMLPPGYITCHRTGDSYTGDYAIELNSIDMDGWIVPGVITLGELGVGYTSGGVAFSGKPEALKGFVKHPTGGDAVMVAVQFFKAGAEIGGGMWTTTDSIPDYTEFIVPITYDGSMDPDTMNITILTDQNQPNSTLVIDGLHFEFATTGLPDNTQKTGLILYPNPCSDRVRLTAPGMENAESRIFGLNGVEVPVDKDADSGTFDMSGLAAGTYVVLVRTPVGIFREKLIKH